MLRLTEEAADSHHAVHFVAKAVTEPRNQTDLDSEGHLSVKVLCRLKVLTNISFSIQSRKPMFIKLLLYEEHCGGNWERSGQQAPSRPAV